MPSQQERDHGFDKFPPASPRADDPVLAAKLAELTGRAEDAERKVLEDRLAALREEFEQAKILAKLRPNPTDKSQDAELLPTVKLFTSFSQEETDKILANPDYLRMVANNLARAKLYDRRHEAYKLLQLAKQFGEGNNVELQQKYDDIQSELYALNTDIDLEGLERQMAAVDARYVAEKEAIISRSLEIKFKRTVYFSNPTPPDSTIGRLLQRHSETPTMIWPTDKRQAEGRLNREPANVVIIDFAQLPNDEEILRILREQKDAPIMDFGFDKTNYTPDTIADVADAVAKSQVYIDTEGEKPVCMTADGAITDLPTVEGMVFAEPPVDFFAVACCPKCHVIYTTSNDEIDGMCEECHNGVEYNRIMDEIAEKERTKAAAFKNLVQSGGELLTMIEQEDCSEFPQVKVFAALLAAARATLK